MTPVATPFVIDELALQQLELDLPVAGLARTGALVSLAWHLRQRDGRRAVRLATEARDAIASLQPDAAPVRGLALRLTLVEAEVHWAFAEYDRAQILLDEAAAVARALDDVVAVADAHWLDALIAIELGDTARRDDALRACEAIANRLGDPQRTLMARAAIARWLVFSDPRLARERWGTEFGDGSGPWPIGVATWVHDFLGNLAFSDGDNGPAILHRLRLHEDAVASGQCQRAVIALTNIGACFSNLNDHDSSLIWMQRGLDEARRLGWPMAIAGALLQVGGILPPLGRLEAALELLTEARTRLAVTPHSRNLVLALHYLGDVLNLQGRHAEALEVLAELEARAEHLQQTDFVLEVRMSRAVALAALGQRTDALALANATLAACRTFSRRAVEIRVLMDLARLESTGPDGAMSTDMADHQAALGHLREAVAVAGTIEGYQIGGELHDALAREHAHAGDFALAYEASRAAAKAREATVSTAALNRSIAMQIGFQTERTRADAELQKSLTATLQRTSATLETLGAIGQEITRHLDEAEVFEILQARVHGLLDATHFSVWQLAESGDAMELAFGIDMGQPMAPRRRIALDSPTSNIARCARTGEEILRRMAPEGFNPNHVPGTVRSASALYAPLRVGEQLLGVMSIQSPQAEAYGERERLIFRTLCAYGAIGLHNARAYKRLEAALDELHQARDELAGKNTLLESAYLQQQEASFTDPLTQLRNRRFLMTRIDDEVALTLRRLDDHQRKISPEAPLDHDLVFYMLDIDHFKAVNDAHGHPAGDAVLVGMAQRLRDVVRESDFLVRWGGEEFLLVARATHAGEGAVLAERLRVAVAARAFDLGDGRSLPMTCSIGFASYPFWRQAPGLVSWGEVTRLADQALYLAKQEGRNRWIGIDAATTLRDHDHFEQICRDPRQAQARGEVVILRATPDLADAAGTN